MRKIFSGIVGYGVLRDAVLSGKMPYEYWVIGTNAKYCIKYWWALVSIFPFVLEKQVSVMGVFFLANRGTSLDIKSKTWHGSVSDFLRYFTGETHEYVVPVLFRALIHLRVKEEYIEDARAIRFLDALGVK